MNRQSVERRLRVLETPLEYDILEFGELPREFADVLPSIEEIITSRRDASLNLEPGGLRIDVGIGMWRKSKTGDIIEDLSRHPLPGREHNGMSPYDYGQQMKRPERHSGILGGTVTIRLRPYQNAR